MDVCHLFRKPGNSTQGRIQVEAFVPVECFWKKVRPSRVITFVLLLLFSLFNHQFVPNLYQCYAIEWEDSNAHDWQIPHYPGAPYIQFQSLVWVTKSPRAHQLVGFFGRCVLHEKIIVWGRVVQTRLSKAKSVAKMSKALAKCFGWAGLKAGLATLQFWYL